jgi:hypothetical protein
MQNSASVQLNNNEDIGWPEEEIMDDGEVTSPNISSVVLEKSCPGLARIFPFLGQVALDRTFADFDPKFEQLPPDSFSSPQSIFLGYLLDEGDRLWGDVWFVLVVF